VWSAIEPLGRVLWLAETFPLFVMILLLLKSYKSFPLTTFSYVIIFLSSTLMLIGAHYSYSLVPLGEWAKSIFGFERNDFDKIGHFFQGFTVAIIVQEFVIRKELINSQKWSTFFTVTFSIAFSAVWEILEWVLVIILIYFDYKRSAVGFLGAQHYIWDTQSDMFFATLGAIIAVYVLGKYHAKQVFKGANFIFSGPKEEN
jgi:putative membrane protein